jgi:hypothetical protein
MMLLLRGIKGEVLALLSTLSFFSQAVALVGCFLVFSFLLIFDLAGERGREGEGEGRNLLLEGGLGCIGLGLL